MDTKLFVAFVIVLAIGGPIVAAQSQPSNYIVGPQDILMITSFDQEDLSGKYPVDADGTFTFPLIGRVKAGGLTLRELEAELKRMLKDGFFKDPYLLWFVTEDAVRTGQLPANVAAVARLDVALKQKVGAG